MSKKKISILLPILALSALALTLIAQQRDPVRLRNWQAPLF